MCLDLLGNLSKKFNSKQLHELKVPLSRYNFLCSLLDLSPITLNVYEVKKRLSLHLNYASFIGKHLEYAEALGDRIHPKAHTLEVAIYLENLRSAHNIGNIIRTTEALQLGRVYLSSGMCSKDHPSVKKAAMGAEAWVPIIENAELQNLPEPLIAIELTPDAKDLGVFSFPQEKFSLALGNEACGLSQEVLKRADSVVQIPLYGRKASLNVANAFAIVANKIREQASFPYNQLDQSAVHLD